MSTGWQSIDDALAALGLRFGAPTPGQTKPLTNTGHVATSEHYQGRARDYGVADSDATAIAQALLPYAQGPNAPIDELFFSPLGIFMKNGQAISPDDSLRQEHYSHAHVGVRPGTDLAAVVAGGAGSTHVDSTGAPTSTSSGAWGGVLTQARSIGLKVAFVAAGVALLALGGMRTVGGLRGATS